MAFPTSTTSDDLATAWSQSRGRASQVRAHAQEIINTSAAGDISAKTIIDYATILADAIAVWDRARVLPGIVAYVREQLDNPAIDIVAEFGAMRTAAINVRDWIITNFPNDGTYLLFISFTADGRYTYRNLTSAQTSGLRVQLTALVNTIA